MIDLLIFSKDRAPQLDLLLRSIDLNFKDINFKNISILYTFSNSFYEQGYLKLKRRFPNINWILEFDFKKDTIDIINGFKNEFSLILVDDEVVVNDFSIKSALKILREDDHLHCISLRMHPNIDYTYTANVPNKFSEFQYVDNLCIWNWRDCNSISDSGYPSCINSHIYRTEDLKYWLSFLKFYNANSLEGQLNNQRSIFNEYIACFYTPKTVCIANNLVQSGTNRHSNDEKNTVEFLNGKYLHNNIIDLEPFIEIEKNTPTFEHKYKWIKYEN